MTQNPVLRALLIGASLLIGSLAQAQPYDIYVMGYVNGCQAGSSVHITSLPGTVPAVDQDVPLNGCSLALILEMDTTAGGFVFSYGCLGSTLVDSAYYQVDQFPDSTSVVFSFNCGSTVDCLGQAGGPNLPGTPCSTFLGQPGTWSPDCLCIADPDSSGCHADFTVQQAMQDSLLIPWQITTTDQSTGEGPITYEWWMPDGSLSTDAEPGWTFNGPGVYGICLTITAGNGQCTDFMCDSVVVDSNGMISTASVWYDCTGALWGTELPGSSCLTFLGDPGTWNANCVCVPDSFEVECQAFFTVEQASGGGALIPWQVNTVNQSTGSGTLSYLWNLPDGTTSTEPEPGFTFNGPGVFNICLTVASDSGCTSTYCDSVLVDAQGFVDNMDTIWVDCTGAINGFALPGTPCTDFLGDPGTWSADCVCITDSSTTCEAGFWAIQAYDSTGNGVEPIPNLVWVWNLSSGGNGTYSFVWDFGDGSSSTEAYPSHEYDGPGPWLLCLTMTSGTCTDTYCDSLSMDENGILEGMPMDGGHPVAHDGNRSGGFSLNVISQIPGGMAELPAMDQLNLWPNPATEVLNLSWVAAHSGQGTVQLLDLSGRTVYTTARRTLAGSNHLTLATDQLEPGLYLVQLELDGTRISQRFMKAQ